MRSQCNRLNVVLMSKIGTAKKRLKQINKEDDDYATGLFRSYPRSAPRCIYATTTPEHAE